jgi:hypothetical protein
MPSPILTLFQIQEGENDPRPRFWNRNISNFVGFGITCQWNCDDIRQEEQMTPALVTTPLGRGTIVGHSTDAWLVLLRKSENPDWCYKGKFVFKLIEKIECEVEE